MAARRESSFRLFNVLCLSANLIYNLYYTARQMFQTPCTSALGGIPCLKVNHRSLSLVAVLPIYSFASFSFAVVTSFVAYCCYLTEVINADLKEITGRRSIDNCVETMAKMNAFITLKDHKENFDSNQKCRLINPAESKPGKVRKVILDHI